MTCNQQCRVSKSNGSYEDWLAAYIEGSSATGHGEDVEECLVARYILGASD